MHKKILAIALSIISILAITGSVMAKDLKTLKTTLYTNSIKIEGTAPDGTLAVTAFLYKGSEGGELLDFESFPVDKDGNYQGYIGNIENAGDAFFVKVADYDGGKFLTSAVKKSKPDTGGDSEGSDTSGGSDKKAPKTGEK